MSSLIAFDGQIELDDGDWFDEPDDDDGEFDDDRCGMMADGTCLLVGTEECDWDCPHSPT
jgi:hypothetical protein